MVVKISWYIILQPLDCNVHLLVLRVVNKIGNMI